MSLAVGQIASIFSLFPNLLQSEERAFARASDLGAEHTWFQISEGAPFCDGDFKICLFL